MKALISFPPKDKIKILTDHKLLNSSLVFNVTNALYVYISVYRSVYIAKNVHYVYSSLGQCMSNIDDELLSIDVA